MERGQWHGETVAVLASGPSMCAEDAEYVRGKARAVVVNTTFRLAPWADALYTNDDDWLAAHRKEIECVFSGIVFCGHWRYRDVAGVHHVPFDMDARGLKAKPGHIAWGMNSGAAALSLAEYFGARKIVMLGFDQAWLRKPDGTEQARWHGAHPHGLQNQKPGFHRWRAWFEEAASDFHRLGIEVVNASRETSLACFPRVALRDALP